MSCIVKTNNIEKGVKNVIYGLLEPSTREIRYIGKSVNLDTRVRKHLQPSKLKENTHKNNWLKKLLINDEKPLVVILKECINEEELNNSEIELIKEYKTIGCRLTNSTNGGDGGKISDESLQKMKLTKALNPQESYWLNKKFTEEHSKNISNAKKGYKASEKTKKKLSESLKGKNTWSKGKKLTSETINKMIEARLGKPKNNKEVYQLSLDGEIIRLWVNPYEAEHYFKLSPSKIHSVCTGKRKTTGGYKWCYKDNYVAQ
jgi:hypothetical protein